MTVLYRIYIDEVGNHDLTHADDPNQRFLSLTGVILESDYTLWVLQSEMDQLKRDFFQRDPDEPVIFHRKELVNKRPPFQVIVGPNGAGKSNLFDALRLLSRLADADLRSAFQGLRGEAGELFTILPEGQITDRMRLAVEMLVERQVQDSWGAQAGLKYTRMRYELEIARRPDEQGLERLYVIREALDPILRGSDAWFKRHVGKTQEAWRWLQPHGSNLPLRSPACRPKIRLFSTTFHATWPTWSRVSFGSKWKKTCRVTGT